MEKKVLTFPWRDKSPSASEAADRKLGVDPALVRYTLRRREVERLKVLGVIAHELPRLVAALEALARDPRFRRPTRS